MINRILIRIKVLQIVYSYYQKGSENLNSAEKELERSLQKSYDLYHCLLLLVTTLTDAEQRKIDALKYKYLPTKQELNPNTRLMDNRFAEQLRTNDTLERFINQYGVIWNENDTVFVRNLLNEILQSDIYNEYIQSPDSYEADHKFWRKVFKDIILGDETLFDILEEKNIYWNSDLEIIGTFVLKTINLFDTETLATQELLPMFKNDEDHQFAVRLLHKTILEYDENEALINRQIQNWDLERIALIDLFIMQIALSEIKNFPSIPVNVTLNEYIDLAKYYSTPKSGHFINGVLDSIVNELKTNGILFKD
ncbi:MAG: transcription antitermination factor NusB [Dysgonamonadaceae bacterium]|jgi:N utilization substance protein B|nr:transcription antitermination factor NusB [Dysgonamonadaceae bacterium]